MPSFILQYQRMMRNPNSAPLLNEIQAGRLFEKVLSDEFLLFSDFLEQELGRTKRDQLFAKFDQHISEMEQSWLPLTD